MLTRFAKAKGYFIVLSEDTNPIIFDSTGVECLPVTYAIPGGLQMRALSTLPGTCRQCSICGYVSGRFYESSFRINDSSAQCCLGRGEEFRAIERIIDTYLSHSCTISIFYSFAPTEKDLATSASEKRKIFLKIFLGKMITDLVPIEVTKIWLRLFFELKRNPWFFRQLKGLAFEEFRSFLISPRDFRKL